MKKIVLLICLSTLAISLLIGQTDNYEFLRTRKTLEGYTTFFDVVNLNDEYTADQIISELRQDENISRADFFKLKNGKNRIHIFCNDNVDANLVRAILQNYDVDYDLSTVILNGEVKVNENIITDVKEFTSTPTPVKYNDFPSYVNTGNKEEDDINYANKKEQWINENPEKYNELLKEMENK